MSKIQDLPTLEKPREKAERFGIESLNDEELLALIINSGTVGHSTLDIARDILHDSKHLSALISRPLQYFHSFKGLKKANAFKLLAVFEIAKRIKERHYFAREESQTITSEALYQRYALRLVGLTQEQLIIIILNRKKQVITEKVLYCGDDNNIPVNHRDILRLLMIHNGYYFYLIHNHPNDSFSPSQADISFTKKIEKEAKHFDVKLLDHIIISRKGYYSFLHAQIYRQMV